MFWGKGLFARTANATVFMSGTFDLFDITSQMRLHWIHETALNPFLNRTKNGGIDSTCKEDLTGVQ